MNDRNSEQLKNPNLAEWWPETTVHSGFNVMDFRYSALFLLSDFKSAPLFFGKSYNKNQNCSETSMDRSLR